MFDYFSRYTIRPAGALLVVVFTVALLWCGDAACREGTECGECTSLLCALLMSQHASDGYQGVGGFAGCHCVCHTPTIAGDEFRDELDLTVVTAVLQHTAFAPPAPSPSIYHPPQS